MADQVNDSVSKDFGFADDELLDEASRHFFQAEEEDLTRHAADRPDFGANDVGDGGAGNDGRDDAGPGMAGDAAGRADEATQAEADPFPLRQVRPLQPEKEENDGANVAAEDRKPDLATACKEEGNRHFAQKDYPTAIACYTEAIRNSPRSATPESDNQLAVYYANRAACYVAMDDKDEDALYDCDRALELNPRYAKVYARRAIVLERLKPTPQLDDALADYKAWAELEPSNKKAQAEVERLGNVIKERDEKLKVSDGRVPDDGDGDDRHRRHLKLFTSRLSALCPFIRRTRC